MTETVLLVEDDMTNRLLVEAVLSSMGGFEVIGTDDGDRVLELVASRELAAVVMDVSLRGTEVAGEKVDGVELTRRIRQIERGAQLPIILLTAHAMTGDRERLLFSSGANDYVPKPITDPNAFVTLLRTHIDTFGDMVSGSPPRGSV